MDLQALRSTAFALLWIFFFIDSNAVLELQLFFHDLSKATYHLYLALLQLRRATTHFANGVRYLAKHAKQSSSHHIDCTDWNDYILNNAKQSSSHLGNNQDQPLAKESMLHFLEGLCVMCEMVPSLMSAALSVGTAFSHILQAGFYILAATLRTIQNSLFCEEKERWDKERLKVLEKEKKKLQHVGVHHNLLNVDSYRRL